MEIGNPARAKELLSRLFSIESQISGEESLKIAGISVHLACAYGDLGETNKQIFLLEKAREKFERLCGPQHSLFAKTLVNLGDAYRSLGQVQQAKLLLEQALPILKANCGEKHPDVASALQNLALAYLALGEGKQAKIFLEEAILIFESSYGCQYYKAAEAKVNLTLADSLIGNRQQVEVLNSSLALLESYYGPDHPQIAKTLVNLGASLDDAEQMKKIYKRAISIFKQHYGAQHPLFSKAIGSLATAYFMLGKLDKAKLLLEQVRKIDGQYYGTQHPEFANTLFNEASIHLDLSESERAKPLLEQALAIQEVYYGPQHPLIARTIMNLGLAYLYLDQAEQAKALFERCLNIQESYYDAQHHDIASTLVNLALAYQSLQNYLQAVIFAERANLMVKDSHGNGENHPITQIRRTLEHIFKNFNEFTNLLYSYAIETQQLSTFQQLQSLHTYLRQSPEDSSAHIQLGHCYLCLNQIEAATQSYETCLHINPELVEVSYYLACCYRIRNNFERAEIFFNVVVAFSPDSRVYAEFGHLLYIQCHYSEAINFFMQSIKLTQDEKRLTYSSIDCATIWPTLSHDIAMNGSITLNASWLAYSLLINSYHCLGDGIKSQEYLQKFILVSEEANNSVIYRLIGYTYQLMENHLEAKKYFKKAKTVALRNEVQEILQPISGKTSAQTTVTSSYAYLTSAMSTLAMDDAGNTNRQIALSCALQSNQILSEEIKSQISNPLNFSDDNPSQTCHTVSKFHQQKQSSLHLDIKGNENQELCADEELQQAFRPSEY